MDVNRLRPAPLRGSELVTVLFKVGFLLDKEQGIVCMNEIAAAMRARHAESDGGPQRKRILLTGVPVGLGSDKVVHIVEQCGGDVVAMENCSGCQQAFQGRKKAIPSSTWPGSTYPPPVR